MFGDWITPLIGLIWDVKITIKSAADGNRPGAFRVKSQNEREAKRRLNDAGISCSAQELNPTFGYFAGRGETSILVPGHARSRAREALGELIED